MNEPVTDESHTTSAVAAARRRWPPSLRKQKRGYETAAGGLFFHLRAAFISPSHLQRLFDLLFDLAEFLLHAVDLVVDRILDLLTQFGARLGREQHGEGRSDDHTAHERYDGDSCVFIVVRVFEFSRKFCKIRAKAVSLSI